MKKNAHCIHTTMNLVNITGCIKKNETGSLINISGSVKFCPPKIKDKKVDAYPVIFHTETLSSDSI